MTEFDRSSPTARTVRDGDLNAVVLVGGGSRRMGRPKQILSRGGAALADIAVAAVAAVADRVVLAGGGPIPDDLIGLERLTDAPGVSGPLGGILAAMRRAPTATWIVSACDMPWIRGEAVEWLVSRRKPTVRAILPRTASDRVEPLLAVYEPTMKDILERRAEMGRYGFQKLAGLRGVSCPRPPDEIRDAWISVNTLEDFEGCSVLDV